MSPSDIVELALGGERRWLARAITLIEYRVPGIGEAIAAAPVRRRTGPGAPHVVGLTGPPGSGKSTLVDRLIGHAREQGKRVAVVAVDPSSPFSGGAILGDRVRMERHSGDDDVFIRSLSSRGHLGGLSGATAEVVDLMDAWGADLVLVETVGVGQSELGIMEVADTTIVVLTPESGDTVQTMKAGLLEIASVFVINKSDRPGSARLARDLARSIELDADASWVVPVHETSALENTGMDAVVASTIEHLGWCRANGLPTWTRRRGDAAVRLYLDLFADRARVAAQEAMSDSVEQQLRDGTLSPHAAAKDRS